MAAAAVREVTRLAARGLRVGIGAIPDGADGGLRGLLTVRDQSCRRGGQQRRRNDE